MTLFSLLVFLGLLVLFGPVAQAQLGNKAGEQHFSTAVGTQSPEAASLGKYGKLPVSLYRGTPDISIPLVEVEARTHSLPLRLRYDASGVKVGKVASWVGQNWTLEAGGVITRTVRGLPDEDTGGYLQTRDSVRAILDDYSLPLGAYGVGLSPEFKEHDVPLIWDVASGNKDAQPDQFFFNVAGFSGQFAFSEDPQAGTKVVRTSKGKRVKLKYNNSTWTLWAPDGTEYQFDQKEASTTNVGIRGDVTYTSSWYLTRINPPNGSDPIQLEYTPDSPTLISRPSTYTSSWRTQLKTNTGRQGEICPPPGDTKKTASTTGSVTENVYLDFIETDQMQIDFVSVTSDREDLDRSEYRRLAKIEVRRSGSLEKTFHFEHSYFTQSVTSTRLRLDRIYVADGNQEGKAYEFGYNGLAPPAYTSQSQDHWGYYNGEGDGLIPDVTFNDSTLIGNTSRAPDTTLMKAGILTDITYPTGGTAHFEYSPHQYGQVISGSPQGSAPLTAGGLRIRKIVRDPKAGSPPMVKRFYYQYSDGHSSGWLLNNPTYKQTVSTGICDNFDNNPGVESVRCPKLQRSSSSYSPLGEGAGGAVAYERVVVTTQTGNTQSRTVHRFDAEGRKDVKNTWPWVPRPAENWRHGHKISSKVYGEGGQLLREIQFVHTTSTREDTLGHDITFPRVRGFVASDLGEVEIKTDDGESCKANVAAASYAVQSGWRRRASKTLTRQDPSNGASSSITRSFSYDPEDRLVRSISKTTSNGLERHTFYKYAHEVDCGGESCTDYTPMENEHMLSQKYQTTVEDSTGTVLRRNWKTWGRFDPDSDFSYEFWAPRTEWTWTGR